MLAAWMLDETTGTRVNLQGNAARDLSIIDSSDPGNSTDRMEGARSMSITITGARHTSDASWADLVSPLSVGCWIKYTQGGKAVMHDWQTTVAGNFTLTAFPTAGGRFEFQLRDSGVGTLTAVSPSVYPTGVWSHVVGTMASGAFVTLYMNGAQAAQVAMSTTAAARNAPFYLGDNSAFLGLLDECWVGNVLLSAASVCRICSCGIRGEQCACSGTSYTNSGRNAASCGSCTLPACNAATPP